MFERNGRLCGEVGGSRTGQRKQRHHDARSLGAKVTGQRSLSGPDGSTSPGHVAELPDGGCPRKGQGPWRRLSAVRQVPKGPTAGGWAPTTLSPLGREPSPPAGGPHLHLSPLFFTVPITPGGTLCMCLCDRSLSPGGLGLVSLAPRPETGKRLARSICSVNTCKPRDAY